MNGAAEQKQKDEKKGNVTKEKYINIYLYLHACIANPII